MKKELPVLLKFLNEELGYDVRTARPILGFELYYLDLSSWKLRLSDRTPVIFVKCSDLEENAPRHLLQSIQDVIREGKLGRQTVLILINREDVSLIKKYASSPLYNYILIGKDDEERIIHSRRPSGELLDLISTQVSISNLAPYETATPVIGSRFFGREFEINRILSNPDTNYLIPGIRRIGKTSLLREIERILKNKQAEGLTRYIDCSDLLTTEDFVREVVRKLNPRELPRLEYKKYVFYFPDFLERMRRMHGGKITFLLDEIDNVVIMERGNWELFRMLRAASNSGNCQFILAGFREAMQEINDLESPFYKFAQEARIGEFTRKQAQDLIIIPMENLRIRFKNQDEVVGRIYEETAGHPNLIQYYCNILLKQLDQKGERTISPDSLVNIYVDEGFKNHLLVSFTQNTHNREKAIVYSLLRDANDARLHDFSQPYMDAVLRKRGIVMTQKDVDEACNILILAGVFHRKGKDFSLTSPVFAKVLQHTYDLDYLLNKVKEEGI